MDQERIETMLQEASMELPMTKQEWSDADISKVAGVQRRIHRKKVLAACTACVLFFCIASVTVLAHMEIPMDAKDYSQWVVGRSKGSWYDVQREMKKRGFVVPEEIGDYRYSDLHATLVSQKGDTYLDALTKKVYHPLFIRYGNCVQEEESINISVGTLEDPYWSSYYEFENLEGAWICNDAEIMIEYENRTIYGKRRCYESGEKMNWRWIDKEAGLCWSVSVPAADGTEGKMDGLEVVKEIIECNKE